MGPKGCQKTKFIRAGTNLWHIFEFPNKTTCQLEINYDMFRWVLFVHRPTFFIFYYNIKPNQF